MHRDRLAPDEIGRVGDLRVTTPLRTAYDLARRHDLVEGVVAVDALARTCEFAPDMLLHVAARYPRRGPLHAPGGQGLAHHRYPKYEIHQQQQRIVAELTRALERVR